MKEYKKTDCTDEEIYVCEDSCYYDLYIKNKYFEENCFIKEKYIKKEVSFKEIKSKLIKPFWEGHDREIDCYWFAWERAFAHIKHPTQENGFIKSYIDTSFNMSTFIADSSAMMWYTKYANHIFNFKGTLDNFYSKQHIDGFICREIRCDNGNDRFHRFDPVSAGPIWLTYTEWELYQFDGDKERLKKVFAPLMAFHIWMKENRTNTDGSYWYSGLSSTMDNQPRVPQGYSRRLHNAKMSWLDANLHMLIDADRLIKIAETIDRKEETADLEKEKVFLTNYIVDNLWDNTREFIFDQNADGSLNDCKTVGAFWALSLDCIPLEIKEKLVMHLKNKEEFNRHNPIPSISADSKMYSPNGAYWRGGVWSCMNQMVFSGLAENGFASLAYELAKRHNANIAKIYSETRTLWEVYAPDSDELSKPSAPDFVGWTGLSAISVLIEFIFGIKAKPCLNLIEWNVNLTEEHGLENYPFAGKTIQLLKCKKRKDVDEEPDIIAKGCGGIMVKVSWNKGEKTIII